MPDVGVLQLKIAANVSSATTSLKTLSSRLDAINKATTNFNLGNVADQIKKIVDSVKGDKDVSTAVKNLGSLLNAISAFSKVKSIGLDDTQINKLQSLQDVANGFKMGQVGTQLNKMREALGGSWDVSQAAEASKAIETLSQSMDTAKSSGTADKIKEVSSSLKDMTGGTADSVGKATSEIVDCQKVVNELGDTLKNQQVTFKEPLMGLNLKQFGGSSTSIPKFENSSVQNWRDEMAGIRGVNDELKNTDTTSINNISDLQRALSELGKIKGADGLQRFADGINAITAAMQNSGDSNLTLGRLASAISRFKEATNGFSIPSFAKLESLARTLQENFNAENGLKRIADGINAFKQATQGMDLSNAKGISSIIKSMSAGTNRTDSVAKAMEAMSDSAKSVSNASVSTGFAETSEKIAEVTTAAEEANNAVSQLDFSVFDPAKLPLGALGMTLDEFRRGGVEAMNFKDALVETDNIVKEMRSSQENESSNTNTTIFSNIEEAAKALGLTVEEVKRQLQETYDSVYGTSGTTTVFKSIEEAAKAMGISVDEAKKKMQDTYNTIYGKPAESPQALTQAGDIAMHQAQRIESARNSFANSSAAIKQYVADLLGISVDDLFGKTAESIDEASGATKSLSERFKELISDANGLKGALGRAFPGLDKLWSKFKQIAKYRFLRAVLREITEGISEGTENYYYYSQVIGGNFATSMDNAASSLQTMKNSIGAAIAPLVSSLIPYLQQAVNLFIDVVNYANQFFALLNGQNTWSRATAVTTTAFDDIADSASEASDSVSDLLADWDELNIIQNENSGSGISSSTSDAQDYAEMFEEVFEYDEKIREIVNFIKDNFDTILSVVEGIGAAILLWKLSRAFGNELSALQKLELTAGLILAINGIKVTTAAGYDIGKNGLNSENLLDAISGILQTSIGGGLVGLAFGGITGGLIGLTVGVVVSLVLLSMNIKDGEKDAMYGEMHLTADEIQSEVDRLFAFDVNVALKSAQVDHNNIETARENIVDALRDMEADFVTFKIRATPENAATLLASVNQVVETTNTLLKYFGKKISIGFGFNINYSDPEFVQAFSIERLGEAETYITTLGNRIGEILQDCVVSEFEEGLYNELTQKLSNVTKAMALGETSAKFASEVEKGYYGTDWTQADRETLINYAKNYGTQVENTKEAGYLQALDTRTALRGVYDYMVQRNIDEPGTYTDKEIKTAWDNYFNYDMQGAIDDYVNQATAEGKQIYVENMTAAFKSAVENSKGFNTTAGGSELLSGEEDALASWFKKNLAFNLGWANGMYGEGDTNTFVEALDIMGESGWNLLTEEMKKNYISSITQAFGLSSDTFSMIKNQLGVPIDDIVAATNWDGLTDEMKNKYITYLSQAYGGREVLEAIYNSGVMGATEMFHIGDYFTNDKTKESFESAINELWGEASNYFEENPVQMKVEPSVEDDIDIESVMGSSANNLNWWTAAIPSFESLWDSVMANISSTLGLNGTWNNGFGNITITTERNDEQDKINIEEGTRRGTAGLETKQSTTNSTLSRIESYVATIANNSGGGGVSGSQAGYLITNALNQFGVVSNSVR